MDKGYKEIQELATRKQPEFVRHGSFSLWVNFHALSEYCILNGGSSMFDSSTNFSIDFGCLSLIKEPFEYKHFKEAYHKHLSLYNLDDHNSIKKLVYNNLADVGLSELLGLMRLNSYDSSIFIKAALQRVHLALGADPQLLTDHSNQALVVAYQNNSALKKNKIFDQPLNLL